MKIRPDTASAVAFLTAMHPQRWVHLVAISEPNRVVAESFAPGEFQQMRAWINKRQGKANLYFHVNELKSEVRKAKAKKGDIAVAHYLHTDVDDLNALQRIEDYSPRPTAIVGSGGGYQAFWRLSQPCTNLDLVERLNFKIAQDLGGDHCHNIDRIMRVPGTINLPNAKKRAAGRSEALSYIVESTDWALEYTADAFGAASSDPSGAEPQVSTIPAHVDLAALPKKVPPYTQILILEGDDPDSPIGSPDARYPSRSEIVFRVLCDLLRAGCTWEQAVSILLDPAYAISTSVREKRNPERHAIKQVRSAAEAVGDGWPDADKRGPKPTYRNTVVALHRLGLLGRHDEFRNRKSVGGGEWEILEGELSDDRASVARNLIIDHFDFDPGKQHTIEALNFICLQNPFHPIRDYLAGLAWDGTGRLDGLLPNYFGAPDTLLNRTISRIVLVAAVRRIRFPGVKFDTVLVLEGKQGTGKSTAIRILAGDENFADQDILSHDAKQQIELLEGVWLFEIGELSGMNRADLARLKAFVSRQVDRMRRAYARYLEDWPRQTVFIGTTNQEKYLRDTTGNRRFWPVSTTSIDLEGLKRDRDQLWAEAAKLEAEGHNITLPSNLWDAAAAEQSARMEDHPWHEALSQLEGTVMGGKERISTEEILSRHFSIELRDRKSFHTTDLARLMPEFGWSSSKYKEGGKTIRGYERKSDKPDTVPKYKNNLL